MCASTRKWMRRTTQRVRVPSRCEIGIANGMMFGQVSNTCITESGCMKCSFGGCVMNSYAAADFHSFYFLWTPQSSPPPAVVHAPVSSPLFWLLQKTCGMFVYAVNIYFVRRLCKGRPCHDVATQAQGIEFAFGNGTYVQFVIVGGVHDQSYVFHWTLALIIDGV